MNPDHAAHVKLLAADFLALAPRPSSSSSSADPPFQTRTGRPVARVEAVGVVVSRDRKERFLRFTVDDGSGCFPCILWLNQLQSAYAAARSSGPEDLRLLADAAAEHADRVRLGALVRVRGRASVFRGELQVTVSDVAAEVDPNAEVLQWLQCLKLSRDCYSRRIGKRAHPS